MRNYRFLVITIIVLFVSGCVQPDVSNQIPPEQPQPPVVLPPMPSSSPTIDIISYDSLVDVGSTTLITWRIKSETQKNIDHTAIHYGFQPVPNVALPSDYSLVSSIINGTIPGTFSVNIEFDTPGTYFFRAHAVIDETNVWSGEQSISVIEPPKDVEILNYIIFADDNGFYLDGKTINSISVKSNTKITVTFDVKTDDVYFGGLEFRSEKFNSGKISPGERWTSPEITMTNTFIITSFWPSSGTKKADLEIIAQ